MMGFVVYLSIVAAGSMVAAPFTTSGDRFVAAAAIFSLDGTWNASLASLTLTIPAIVPGDLVSDLQRAGKVRDPLKDINWLNTESVGLWNASGWTYSRHIELDGAFWQLNGSVFVVFDSIKMGATIAVNATMACLTCRSDPANAAACGNPLVSFECDTDSQGKKYCQVVAGTGGAYKTMAECESTCMHATYNCENNQCVKNPAGQSGTYANLTDCLSIGRCGVATTGSALQTFVNAMPPNSTATFTLANEKACERGCECQKFDLGWHEDHYFEISDGKQITLVAGVINDPDHDTCSSEVVLDNYSGGTNMIQADNIKATNTTFTGQIVSNTALIHNCTFIGAHTQEDGDCGGAISATSNATITDSVFMDCSTSNATTIIRFIAITSEAKIKGMELTINSIAETVSSSLLTTRGLAITPESIVKWVYFDWPNRKLAEWRRSRERARRHHRPRHPPRRRPPIRSQRLQWRSWRP
eukprot:g2235.t1